MEIFLIRFNSDPELITGLYRVKTTKNTNQIPHSLGQKDR